MSSFANITVSDLGAVSIECVILGSACPMCCNASYGDIITIVWFADGVFTLLSVISLDMFCMIMNGLDLCGVAAIGLIFSRGGCFSLISFHFNIVQHLSFCFCSALAHTYFAASASIIFMCGPLFTAALISPLLQSSPQSNLHPSSA